VPSNNEMKRSRATAMMQNSPEPKRHTRWALAVAIGVLCLPSLLPLYLWHERVLFGTISPGELIVLHLMAKARDWAGLGSILALALVAWKGSFRSKPSWPTYCLLLVGVASCIAAVTLEAALAAHWARAFGHAR
jgi:hypothetical protein